MADTDTVTTNIEGLSSLTITKTVEGGGNEAANKTYRFTVTGPSYPNGREVTITGSGSLTLSDLVSGKYTVTEQDADIEGYTLEVTGNGDITVKADGTATAAITNTYTQKLGSLKITKELANDAPGEATSKVYTFTVTGPSYPEGHDVTITGAGDATLADLIPGPYAVTEKDANIEGYTLDVTGEGSVTVAAEETATATITNTYTQKLGSLKITKALGADAPEAAKSMNYTFTVTGPEGYSETVTISGAGSNTLNDLVPGEYTVTEVENSAHIGNYELVVTGGSSVTVVAEQTAEVTVTNTYTPKPVTQTSEEVFKVIKTLDGPVPSSATNSFTFALTGEELENTRQITVNYAAGEIGNKDASFAPLTFDHAGTYNYTINEVQGSQPGYSYDGTTTTVTVVVVDDNGQLKIESTTYTNSAIGETDAAKFTNTYNPGELTFTPTITKVIDGETPATASTFNFELKLTSGAPENVTITDADANVEGAGSASFGEITIVSPGIYTFEITEIKGNDTHYTYDTKTITLTLVVGVNKSGDLFLESSAYTDNATFTNTYDPEDVTLAPAVSKTVVGDAPKDETFSFAIAADENNPTGGAQIPENVATVAGSGEAEFDEITFTKAGTYTYTIKEEQPEQIPGGWTYDDSVWTLTVTVADNGGQLEVVSSAYTKNGETAETANAALFTNTYDPTDATYVPVVNKVVETGNFNPEMPTFTFTIEADEGNPMPTDDTATVTGSGEARFDAITFTKSGTYTYTIKEERPEQIPGGWTYDQSAWTLTVTVTDVDAVLVASATYAKDGGPVDDVDAAQFTNSYDPGVATYVPVVNKVVDANVTPGQMDFNFTIEAGADNPADGATMPENTTATVTGAGSANFGNISFTKTGTYTYTIKEEQPEQIPGGWTYDDSEWTLTVEVTDVNGVLTASAVYAKDGETAETAEFTNTYTVYTVTYSFDGDVPGGVDLPDSASYVAGADVTVAGGYEDIVINNEDGSTTTYHFEGWMIGDEEATNFPMPGNNVTIVGTWSVTTTQPQTTDPDPDPEVPEEPEEPEVPEVPEVPEDPEDPEPPVDLPDDDPPLAEDPTENEDPEDPEPPVDLPDDDPPLAEDPTENEDPEDPEPPVDLPDDDPPLAEDPTENEDPEDPEPPVDLPDDDPPLGEDPGILIPDPEVPMDPAPQTGDNFAASAWMALFVASTLGLAVLYFEDKKKAN